MSKVLVTDTNLTNIANAIRNKNGEVTTYKPNQMAEAINAIETGTDTSDATASALDIISPKTAYIANGKVTGSIIPTFDPSAPTLADDIALTYSSSFDDIDTVGYKVAVCCTSSISIKIYGITKADYTGVTNTLSRSSFTDNTISFDIGTARLGRKYTTIDGTEYIRLIVSGKITSSSNYHGIATCLINTTTLECSNFVSIVTASITQTFKGAVECVPSTDDTFITVNPYHSYGTNKVSFDIVKVSNTSTLIVKHINTLENSSSHVVTTPLGNHIMFDVSGNAVTVLMQSLMRGLPISSGAAHCDTLVQVVKSTDNFTTFNTLYTEVLSGFSGTYVFPQFVLLGKNYLFKNGKIYNMNDTSAVLGTATLNYSESTPKISLLGSYLFVTDENNSNLYVHQIDDTNVSLINTISIVTGKMFKADCDTVLFVRSNNILNAYIASSTQGTLRQLERNGTVFYNTEDSLFTTAADVLEDKVFYNDGGKIKGTMTNRGAKTLTPSKLLNITIPKGYHNGSGYVKKVTSSIDSNIKAENIKKDISILGVTGTFDSVLTQEEYDECLTAANAILFGADPSFQYTELEYIKSTGTQYINTLVIPSSKIKVQIKYSIQTFGEILIGFFTAETKTLRFFEYQNVYYLDYGTGENRNRIFGGSFSLNTVYENEIGNRYVKNLATGSNVISGTSVGSFNYTDSRIGIFAGGDGTYSGIKATLYYCKIYENNILVRDFIPVKRKSDNAVCLYDKVSNTFFLNAGTGNFTAGPIKEVT